MLGFGGAAAGGDEAFRDPGGKGLRPSQFRQDLTALFDLLQQRKITPLIAQRCSLVEARQAHELLGKEGVTGKIVLVCNGPSFESGAA